MIIVSDFDIPARGYIVLWSVAIIVLVVGIAEITTKSWYYETSLKCAPVSSSKSFCPLLL